MFDYVVFIGRFQPFHQAHYLVVEQALQRGKKVILLLGSVNIERSHKNPFHFDERQLMISNAFAAEKQRLVCVGVEDVFDDQKWVALAKQAVHSVTHNESKSVALIGHFKDSSSYYLDLFSEWQLISLDGLLNELSATPIRNAYWQGKLPTLNEVPQTTLEFLKQFQSSQDYIDLARQWHQS